MNAKEMKQVLVAPQFKKNPETVEGKGFGGNHSYTDTLNVWLSGLSDLGMHCEF